MYLFMWIAAAWLAAATIVTMIFFGAKRSRLLNGWLFGDKPTAEVRRLIVSPAKPEQTRLAA